MKQPIYIFGPCAAESEEQVMAVGRAIAGCRMQNAECTMQNAECTMQNAQCTMQHAECTVIFRAGLWKPRTSPDTFQGVGEQGLAWLQRVQHELGMPVATEVATPEQTRLAMEAGIDYLWIGARTSANPIAVGEIVEAIQNSASAYETPTATKTKRADALLKLKGLFIKNPVNEDTALWIGNIKRLQQTGLPVYAIHRGCGHRPCWHMPYELRQAMPDLPILLDPSHMSGDAAQVPTLCHQAAELGLDGLMVEVHPCPEQALSDSKQQISPDGLRKLNAALLKQNATLLKLNATLPKQNAALPKLDELVWLRAMMDEVDDRLWDTIRQRMDISRQIGIWKRQHGVEVLQPQRFEQIRQRRLAQARETDISDETVNTILDAIHKESVRKQS